MKKILIVLIAMFAMTANTYAEDKIVINDVELPENGSANLGVIMISQEKQYYAFQFDLKLPKGITASANASNLTERAQKVSQTWAVAFKQTDVENNIWNCIAYNMENAYIDGTEGVVLNIKLTADETLTQGLELEGSFMNVVMSTRPQKLEPAGGTFKINIGEDRVIFNETDTELPLYTAGKGNVRVNRVLKAGKWNTICLPFGMTQAQVNDKFGEGHVLVAFDNWEVEFPDETALAPSGITVNFKKVTAGRTYLVGGTPYLIKSEKDVESFDLDEVTLVAAPKAVSKSITIDGKDFNGVFEGTFTKTVVPADGLFINSEKFYYSTGKTNIKAFRGWFMLDGVLNADMDFSAKIGFTIDGDATDIDGIPSFQRIVEGVYDLSGRKIQLENGDLNKLQKGVYIIDGKKVTIK